MRIQQVQKQTDPDPDAIPYLVIQKFSLYGLCTLVQAVFIFAGACCSRCNRIPFGTV
jgi:hypothetical protein